MFYQNKRTHIGGLFGWYRLEEMSPKFPNLELIGSYCFQHQCFLIDFLKRKSGLLKFPKIFNPNIQSIAPLVSVLNTTSPKKICYGDHEMFLVTEAFQTHEIKRNLKRSIFLKKKEI